MKHVTEELHESWHQQDDGQPHPAFVNCAHAHMPRWVQEKGRARRIKNFYLYITKKASKQFLNELIRYQNMDTKLFIIAAFQITFK